MSTVKKHLGLKPLIEGFKQAFKGYKDDRRESSVNYSVLDTALSTLACMFYKSGSLIHFQKNMTRKYHKNNLQTMFGVTNTPSDNQIRSIIASITPDTFKPIFKNYLGRLQRSKYLEKFRFKDKYLVVIDGTQYHNSATIKCSECLTKEKRNGKVEYSHYALQPIICHPDQRVILPMMPEAIKNEDGMKKQDCEINAAKRLLPKLRAQHPRMNFIWLADSIYATAPFIKMITDKEEDFIIRIKKGDHKHLYKHLDESPHHSYKTTTGKSTIACHWYDNVPLNKSTDITVSVIKAFVITTDRKGNKISTIAGVWATNLDVNEESVISITKAARSRWKIENQCFNALKNEGYELTHNWGHVKGESFNFYIFVMLGFYLHQIFELSDQIFNYCRKVCGRYVDLWAHLRMFFNLYLYDSWEHALKHCIDLNNTDPPIPL